MEHKDITSGVYRPEQVMQLLSCSITTARRVIRMLNNELEAKGFYTIEARVPISYFHERFHIANPEAEEHR